MRRNFNAKTYHGHKVVKFRWDASNARVNHEIERQKCPKSFRAFVVLDNGKTVTVMGAWRNRIWQWWRNQQIINADNFLLAYCGMLMPRDSGQRQQFFDQQDKRGMMFREDGFR